jgi:hypothetical protein
VPVDAKFLEEKDNTGFASNAVASTSEPKDSDIRLNNEGELEVWGRF